MSLIGTRPPTVDEWEKYELHHRARLAIKPGLTGMWQVSGRSEITDFEKVVKLDTKYISEDKKLLYLWGANKVATNSIEKLVTVQKKDISAFLGLTVLAQYQNYYYIMSSVIGFMSIIYNSITAGVGNSMLTKSVDQNYKEFRIFTLLVSFINGICCACFMGVYQPFMKLWIPLLF